MKCMENNCFWFHRWGKWTDKIWSEICRGEGNDVIGLECIQERHCERCNMVQLRSEKALVGL